MGGHSKIPSGKNPEGDLTLIQIAAKFSTEKIVGKRLMLRRPGK